MSRLLSPVLALGLLVTPAFAGYEVEVTAVPTLQEETGRVAVLPAVCPPEANCFGESEWRGKKGVLLKIVRRVLRDAYASGK